MVRADYKVLVDWSNDGDFTGTGEDVTARTLVPLEVERGRDYASALTGRSVAGNARIILNNESGDYSSFSTGSPLAGNLVPGRKVQVQAGGGEFPFVFEHTFPEAPLFTGHIDRLVPIADPHGVDKVILEAWGVLGHYNQKDVEIAMQTSRRTDQAIGDILDAAGFPAAGRTLATGQTTMTRFWQDRARFLTALRTVEETEGGFIKELRDGGIEFEDRHKRLKSPHTTSQATFTDAGGGATERYQYVEQLDPLPFIFNTFEAEVFIYTVESLAVLYTHEETGADSPLLVPGESRTFWFNYPGPDAATNGFAVDAWTTPVSSTDYTANSASGGGGTDLTADIGVAVSKLSNAMKVTFTNNHATLPAYLTLIQGRGTAVTVSDPIRVRGTDATSEAAYGERSFTAQTRFFPDSGEAQDWCNYNLAIYKDPVPIITLRVNGNTSEEMRAQVFQRDLSDRITLTATGNANLGINEDFFIEGERHTIGPGGEHWTEWVLSPADGYSLFWALGLGVLGTSTGLGY